MATRPATTVRGDGTKGLNLLCRGDAGGRGGEDRGRVVRWEGEMEWEGGWDRRCYRDEKGAGELATTEARVFSRHIVSHGLLT